ncbi:MAG: hypothetical protein ABW124_08850, partial [Candidatus Thiodiazotropha sp. 6PLUC9]
MADLLPREHDLLIRIDENEELRPLFFRKVHGLKWFDHLAARNYFEPDQNPAPTSPDDDGYFRIPTWQVTDYLVKTAPELASEDGLDYAKKFLEVIVSTTCYAQENDFSNYRTWWQFAEILRHIPTAAIGVNDLDVIDYWLDDRFDHGLVAREIGEKWLPVLLESREDHELTLATRVIELVFTIKFVDKELAGREIRDAILRVDHHYTERIAEKTANLGGVVIGASCVKIFDKQLNRILSELKNDKWSVLWQPAIEDHEQNKYRDDAENTIVRMYRDSLAGYISVSANEAFDFVSNMLAGDYETTKRIAIHTVNENFRVCRELIEPLIDSQYLTENLRHEMWELFNNHYHEFTGTERSKLIELILEIKRNDDDGNFHPTATAYSQANWLAAIRYHSEMEASLYKSKVEVAGVEPDHPSFSSFTSSGTVVHESPIPLEQLHGMNVDQLVAALDGYRGDSASYREPGIEGLSKSLREVIRASPLRYSLDLPKFINLDLAYIQQIVEAFRELWVEKASLPWNDIWPSLLRFCLLVVQDEEFWGDDNAKQRHSFVANRYWVVSSIAMLIEAGTKSDDNAFDAKFMPFAEDVVAILLSQESGESFIDSSDAVSIAINSPRGRSLEALINMTLRSCRLADNEVDKKRSDAWGHFEHYFESELERTEIREYEFATLVTNYLPNFLYMSREWTLKNLSRIFDRNDKTRWRCAMQGYAYVGTVYQEIFEFLKENEHFSVALDDELLIDRVRESVVQNIGVAYKSGYDKLSDKGSLINLLVARGNHDELSQLVWLFWTMRKGEDEDLRAKVFDLWERIISRIGASTLEDIRLLSN